MSTLLALSRRGIATTPRVASRLHSELNGDVELIVELAAQLTPAQRAGHTTVQDPLPLTPGIEHRTAPMLNELSASEQAVLLRAAVCVLPRTNVLLNASGTTMADLAASPLSRYLKFVAGRFDFPDPRLRSGIHERSTLSERSAAHRDLAQAYADCGNPALAHWHQTLSTVEGDPVLAPPLLALSQRRFDIGDAC